jgi:adenosylcobyric acid synthase
MILGTSSSAGKSILATALCRVFSRRGVRVAPFKAQNMSLNSFVTPGGHEIGRAQAVQAEAAGIAPEVEMNPILLKPEADSRSQVVLMGKPWKNLKAREYYPERDQLWASVTRSLESLSRRFDLILCEGAGSPVELNLKTNDIVNMRVAEHLDAPAILVGDIDRGGIFSQLLGTLWLLDEEEQTRLRGFVVNKFRGDPTLFEEGIKILEQRSGVPVLGVLPYIPDLGIAQEDSVYLDDHRALGAGDQLDIAVVHIPYMSNYDDYDALALEPGVQVRFIRSMEELGATDAIILPGSKTTLADLDWLRRQGLDREIMTLCDAGKAVVGICGGYQMLGMTIRDSHGVEGTGGKQEGLGLLPIDTMFEESKTTHQVRAHAAARTGFAATLEGIDIVGYEIHMGQTSLRSGGQPLFETHRLGDEKKPALDGAISNDGRVWGTYLHGVFDNPGFRQAWLRTLGWQGEGVSESLAAAREKAYERLADITEVLLDIDRIEAMVGL